MQQAGIPASMYVFDEELDIAATAVAASLAFKENSAAQMAVVDDL
jgi:hypothetical protein